jgi:epoxide hydrolase
MNMSNINPFHIAIPDTELKELQARLHNTRWPSEVQGVGWTRGVPLDYLKKIAHYWETKYDWRKAETRLNTFPQFTTTIDGQLIHFIHVTSPEPDATPLLLNHGYPGSIVEMLEIIEPLTNPIAFGGDASDAFQVVVPSIPGLGFSNPVPEPGWETSRIAKAYAELMERLGYELYGVQGSDVGAGICNELCLLKPDKIIGSHISTDPTALALVFDEIKVDESKLSAVEKKKLEALRAYQQEGKGYLQIQGTRPQTLAYGLTDSPVAQLAWIIEKFKEWTNDKAALPEDAVPLDTILTNVSVYWFTKSGASAAHLLYNAAHAQSGWGVPTVPMGFAVFNTSPLMRLAMDPEHHIIHWSEFKEGGHFPALEAPKQLVDDIRTFFRELRQASKIHE